MTVEVFCHEVDINKWKIACVAYVPKENIDFLNVSRLNVCACTRRLYISISLYILQAIKKHLENDNFTECASSAVEVKSDEENVYVSIQNDNEGWNDEEVQVLWARGSVPICRDGPISKWRLQSMY